MSFKKSFKKESISKLDNLVDTPSYIKPVEIEKKDSTPKRVGMPIFWKVAIPVLSASLLIGIPIILISNMQMSSSSKNMSGGDYAPGQNDPASVEPGSTPAEPELNPLDKLVFNGAEYQRYLTNYENVREYVNEDYLNLDFTKPIGDLIGEKITDLTEEMNAKLYANGGYSLYHFKGSEAISSIIVYNNNQYYFYILNNTPKNETFNNVLTTRGLNGDMIIEVYNINSYKYEFNTEIDKTKTASIIDGLKAINSDYDTYTNLYKSGEFDVNKNPVGKCYKFVLTDGVDQMPMFYYSQFKFIQTEESAFDISTSPIIDIFGEFIEMK